MSREIKQEFIEKQCLKERNPEKWAKYLNSTYSDCLKIDGYYLPIEKERIQKDFCFGAGQNGITTTEEWNNANDMASYARNSEKYFIQENLGKINKTITELEYFLLENWEEQKDFYNKNNNLLSYSIQFQKPYILKCYEHKVQLDFISQSDFENKHWLNDNKIKELTKQEIKEILEAIKQEKENFTKRLNTYLKKYGLSKINSWSYISD